jgi:hypothetical protein
MHERESWTHNTPFNRLRIVSGAERNKRLLRRQLRRPATPKHFAFSANHGMVQRLCLFVNT